MTTLEKKYVNDNNIIEIGVDEVGRGPMFGRVYTAAVILPKQETNDETLTGIFKYSLLKDSKKFSSKKKIKEVYDYIIENCIDYEIQYETEKVIDDINILQATQKSMHKCIQKLIQKNKLTPDNTHLLIDGNYFKPHTSFDKDNEIIQCYNHTCVKGGDNTYCSIAAASILAKVARDKYIEEICSVYPVIDEYYSILSNKGYGSKKHMEGIKNYGITPWHRKSFGICKTFDKVIDEKELR